MANYRKLARGAARRYGIDPNVFARQINTESGYNPNALSSAGAIGIAQFMPGTARSEGVNPRDPRSALFGAARLDAKLIKQTGSYRKALAAYNAGPGNIPAGLGYADKILGGRMPQGGAPSAPQTPAPSAYGADSRQQIALSLLGLGGLAGGSYGGGDSLTTALLQATQQGQGQARGGVGHIAPGPANGSGVANFDGKPVEGWIAPILKAARQTGIWKGSVTSGVRTKAQQLAAASHFGLQHYGAGGPLGSNHLAGRGAVDVSDPQGLARALAHLHMQNRLRNSMPQSDPVHFSKTGY